MLKKTINKAEEFEEENKIDSLKNLKGKNIFIYSGAKDTLAPPWNQRMQYDFLTHFGANVKYMVAPNEYHSMP